MSTETELRSALRHKAEAAPVLDVDRLLAGLEPGTASTRPRSTRMTSTAPGRRWAIAGVAAAGVALAAAPLAVVHLSPDDGGSTVAAAGSPTPPSSVAASSEAPTVATGPSGVDPPPGADPTSTWPVDPDDPVLPHPTGAGWTSAADDPTAQLDDSAIVFADVDPGFTFLRPGEQLTVLPAAATAKDSVDALWNAAVNVYLPNGGFDPATMTDATPVTVGGVAMRFGTLGRLLDTPGPARVPSLLWQVGADWVVLQIDTPPVPTLAQLTTASGRFVVRPG